MKNNYGVEKQTHDLPNRIRNHASLLVLAVWTLGDRVAPEQEEFRENVGGGDHDDVYDDQDDDNWIAPDRSDGEELSSLVLLRGDDKERASADNAMFPSEDSLFLVVFLTLFFVLAIFALKMIVTLELLLHTNLLPGKSPISSRAHQLIFCFTVSTSWRLVSLVTIPSFKTV